MLSEMSVLRNFSESICKKVRQKNMMKNTIMTLLMLAFCLSINAEDHQNCSCDHHPESAHIESLPTTLSMGEVSHDKLEVEMEINMMTKYMWRGCDKGGITFKPEVMLSWKGLSLTVEGGKGIDKEDEIELDLELDYEFPFGLNVGIIDYWDYDEDIDGKYFYFKKDSPHRWEANIGYSNDLFSIQAYSIFAGNDYKHNGDRAYSTYFELTVPFKLSGFDWKAKLGFTPAESAGSHHAGENLYADKAAFVMASVRATKELHFKNFHLPVYGELHTNPYTKKAMFVGGVTLEL